MDTFMRGRGRPAYPDNDQERFIIETIVRLRTDQLLSAAEIAHALNRSRLLMRGGKPWTPQSIGTLVRREDRLVGILGQRPSRAQIARIARDAGLDVHKLVAGYRRAARPTGEPLW